MPSSSRPSFPSIGSDLPRCSPWSGTSLRRPRRPAPSRQGPVHRPPVRYAWTRLRMSRLCHPLQTMPEPGRHSRHTKASSGRPHQARAQLLLHQVLALSPSTTSLHRRNASRSTRSRDIHSFAAGEAFLRSCTKQFGPGFSALHGNTNKTYHTTGFTSYHTTSFTSFDIGQVPLHNTASPTTYTDRCASGPLTANERGPGENKLSPPGTALYRALSDFNASALLPSPQGHTSGTKPATALVVRQGSPSHLDRQLFRQLLHRSLPR